MGQGDRRIWRSRGIEFNDVVESEDGLNRGVPHFPRVKVIIRGNQDLSDGMGFSSYVRVLKGDVGIPLRKKASSLKEMMSIRLLRSPVKFLTVKLRYQWWWWKDEQETDMVEKFVFRKLVGARKDTLILHHLLVSLLPLLDYPNYPN
ncbi:hypothetical protein ACH5RR_032047 [Cinchona calisaya]|uniref:Uncharacterized protein n=1 Tax=Cinchona calisaya TaxID=153742 RepID=A0ABD2YL78_9GENT